MINQHRSLHHFAIPCGSWWSRSSRQVSQPEICVFLNFFTYFAKACFFYVYYHIWGVRSEWFVRNLYSFFYLVKRDSISTQLPIKNRYWVTLNLALLNGRTVRRSSTNNYAQPCNNCCSPLRRGSELLLQGFLIMWLLGSIDVYFCLWLYSSDEGIELINLVSGSTVLCELAWNLHPAPRRGPRSAYVFIWPPGCFRSPSGRLSRTVPV